MNPYLPPRRSPRWAGFDYRTPGAYFVTICTHGRSCTLGRVIDDRVVLSTLGRIMSQEWPRTLKSFDGVQSPAFVVMPNHVHGIVETGIAEDAAIPVQAVSLSSVIYRFKATVTRRAQRELGFHAGSIWQRSYFDRFLRNEREIDDAHDYIASNPARWSEDHENPARRLS